MCLGEKRTRGESHLEAAFDLGNVWDFEIVAVGGQGVGGQQAVGMNGE